MLRRYENKKFLRAGKHPKGSAKRTKEQDAKFADTLKKILSSNCWYIRFEGWRNPAFFLFSNSRNCLILCSIFVWLSKIFRSGYFSSFFDGSYMKTPFLTYRHIAICEFFVNSQNWGCQTAFLDAYQVRVFFQLSMKSKKINLHTPHFRPLFLLIVELNLWKPLICDFFVNSRKDGCILAILVGHLLRGLFKMAIRPKNYNSITSSPLMLRNRRSQWLVYESIFFKTILGPLWHFDYKIAFNATKWPFSSATK